MEPAHPDPFFLYLLQQGQLSLICDGPILPARLRYAAAAMSLAYLEIFRGFIGQKQLVRNSKVARQPTYMYNSE